MIRFQVGGINFSVHRSHKDLFEPYINVNLNQSQSFSSISCCETVNLTEAIITAARLSLSEIFKLKRAHKDCTSNKKDNSEELLKNWINSTIDIAIWYDEMVTFWLDCVWNDWYVDTSVCHQDLLLPANQMKAVIETICLYRSEAILATNSFVLCKEWSNLEKNDKEIFLKRPRITILSINKNGEMEFGINNYFNLENIDKCVPHEIGLLMLVLEKNYFKNLLTESLPELHNLTLIQILEAWTFISSMMREIKNQIPELDKILHSQDLLQYSPVFSQNNLVNLMSRTLRLTSEQAVKIIELLTFKGESRDDLWYRPLIKVSEEKLTMIFASLESQNLIRCVEKWLEEGLSKKGKLPDRLGKSFEQFVRDEIRECNRLTNVKVFKTSFGFTDKNNKKGDIDFIFKIGSKLIIGEVKRSNYPSNPIEFHNYYRDLEKASNQLNRIIKDYINPNLEKFLKKTGFSNLSVEQIRIVPVIISSLPFATGRKFQNIPVVDLEILKRYVNEGKTSDFTVTGESKKLIQEISFYSSEEEAEKLIEQYLAEPPQLKIFFNNVRWNRVPIPNLAPNKKPIYRIKGFIESLNFH